MVGNLGKPCRRRRSGRSPLAPLLVGCTSGPGGARFTLFPSGHRMLDSPRTCARRRRTARCRCRAELDKRLLPPYLVEPGDSILVQQADLTAPFQLQLPGDQTILPTAPSIWAAYALLQRGRQDHARDRGAGDRTPEGAGQGQGVRSDRGAPRGAREQGLLRLGDVNAPGGFPLQRPRDGARRPIAAGGPDRPGRRGRTSS